MRVLWAVVTDLWRFMFGISPNVVQRTVALVPAPKPDVLLPAPPRVNLLGNSSHDVSSDQVTSREYATSVHDTALYTVPVQGFDTVFATVPYATTLTVVRRNGRWCEIVRDSKSAWVLSDNVAPLSEVLPVLQIGKIYDDPGHVQVQRLRACIGDAFQAGAVGMPLLGPEYVTYELWRHGLAIPWPMNHSRVPGSWQRKLRGQSGVYIDIKPHTGSLMEYIIEEVGYLAYVSEVAPDATITIRAVGLTHEGQYTEERLPLEVWRELHPVFITIA